MSLMPQLPRQVFDILHPAIRVYICHLKGLIREQAAQISKLEERERDLENRQNLRF